MGDKVVQFFFYLKTKEKNQTLNTYLKKIYYIYFLFDSLFTCSFYLRIILKYKTGSRVCYSVCLNSTTRKGQKALPELCSRIGSDNFNIGVRSNMAAYGWKY